ncbi:hypothetical protein D3C78_1235840 [compost metagenome]
MFVLGMDGCAHDPQQLGAQARDAAGQLLQARQRDAADHAGFQGDGEARVAEGAQAVEAEHIAGQVKAGDLLLALAAEQIGLEGAGAHGMQLLQGFAGSEQVLAFVQRPAALDDVVQLLQLAAVQVGRKAMRADRAVATADALALAPAGRLQTTVLKHRGRSPGLLAKR